MLNAGNRRVKTGDILELQTPRGLSYAQYVGKHTEYGDVIRVVSGWHGHRVTDFVGLLSQSGYLAFYPASAAVKNGLAEIVGSHPLPVGVSVPQSLRRAGARGRTGQVLTWIVEIAGHDIVCKELDEAQRKLPIAAVWDHALLIERISQGWSPEQEG